MRIRGTRRPRNRPKQVYAYNKYNTTLVMMYLGGRDIIAARIKERINKKKRPCRPHLFDYVTYSKVRSSIERFFSWLEFQKYSDPLRYTSINNLPFGFLPLVCVMILTRRVSR
jgi:hypothetical protein